MSFAAGFTAGLMAGKKKFGDSGSGSGSGDGELWTPPADWPEVPEPGANEACFLVEAKENAMSVCLVFADAARRITGKGTIIFDWGDGNSETLVGGTIDENGNTEGDTWDPPTHTYSEAGQYIVKVTTDEYNCLLQRAGTTRSGGGYSLLIAKLGANIVLQSTVYSNYSTFQGCYGLRWVAINGNSKLPNDCFNSCFALKRLDLINKITEIPQSCFNSCYSLKFKNIDFSEVTKINNNGLSNCYNLEKISALKCTSVGSSAFSECYALETATFAEGCTYGSGAFSNCYNLYPRPDGSTS